MSFFTNFADAIFNIDNLTSCVIRYSQSAAVLRAQDDYCTKAFAGQWDDIAGQKFPDDLKWEALVDVMRGKTKVHTHCYEEVDLDAFIRVSFIEHAVHYNLTGLYRQLSNEFEFPIAAFHHAMETYLVPDLLKKAYGGKTHDMLHSISALKADMFADKPPSSAMFGSFARGKREMYRHSVYAPRILDESGLGVVMKASGPIFVLSLNFTLANT